MNFNIFKKVQPVELPQLVEVSNQYLKRLKEVSEGRVNNLTDIDNINKEMQRLKRLKLNNTKNYQLLLNKAKVIKEESKNNKDILSTITDIKGIHMVFPQSIIMGIDPFEKILKDHKLSIGLLNDYTGTIPEKNIQEIENYFRILSSTYIFKHIPEKGPYKFRVDEIEISNEDKREYFQKFFSKTNNIIYLNQNEYDTSWSHPFYTYMNSDDNTYSAEYRSNCFKIFLDKIGYETLFIASPKEFFSPQPIKFKTKPVDPIVFQIVNNIIIIHSVWGKETEHQIIKEYTEYNKLFDNL